MGLEFVIIKNKTKQKQYYFIDLPFQRNWLQESSLPMDLGHDQ